MTDEEIAGYLIRRELENGEDEFWNVTEEWVADPGDAELYEQEKDAQATAEGLRSDDTLLIVVEEVIYDDEEDEDFEDVEEEDKE